VDIISGAIVVLFVIVLFLAFRPEWRAALAGVQYRRILRGERLVTVRITSVDSSTDLTFEDVDWLDLIPFITLMTEPEKAQEAKPLRERIRFWHVATIIALVGAVVVLLVSSEEQNQAGAWGVIGAVVGVWIKPSSASSDN
jgi:hypothetical protein